MVDDYVDSDPASWSPVIYTKIYRASTDLKALMVLKDFDQTATEHKEDDTGDLEMEDDTSINVMKEPPYPVCEASRLRNGPFLFGGDTNILYENWYISITLVYALIVVHHANMYCEMQFNVCK